MSHAAPQDIRKRIAKAAWKARAAAIVVASIPAAVAVAMLTLIESVPWIPWLISVTALVAYWTYVGVRKSMQWPIVRVLWLRKFQDEPKGRFRVSQVVDGLSGHGIAPITLQDRDVRRSHEQWRSEFAARFWSMFVAIVIAVMVWALLYVRPDPLADRDWTAPFGDRDFVVGMLVLASPMLALPLLIIAAALGSAGQVWRSSRYHFTRLSRLLDAGVERRRGALILRIQDDFWQDAVLRCLAAVDVVVIDISEVGEAILWEVTQALRSRPASSFVLIARHDADLTNQLAKIAHATHLTVDPSVVLRYPADKQPRMPQVRHRLDSAFAISLRARVFDAYNNTHSDAAIAAQRQSRSESLTRIRARRRALAIVGLLTLVVVVASACLFAEEIGRLLGRSDP